MHNLIHNSIKFTKEGGVVVELSVSPPRHNLRQVQFEVVDTGIGVSEEKIEQLFEPFSQADVATTRQYGGTGLGLSIVKGLVDTMGGKIDMSSHLGNGTAITVKLPLPEKVEDGAIEVDEAPKETGGGVSKLRILAADDNIVNQAVLKTFLAHREHVVKIANNGLEALDACKQERFDLILMDISMPVLDGVEALRQIRFWERNTNAKRPTPVIAVSAHAMHHQIEEHMAAGFSGYLTKPVREEDLHSEIDRVIEDQKAVESFRQTG